MEHYEGQRPVITGARVKTEVTNAFLRRVYQWMTLGLGVTAVAAYFVSNNATVLNTLAQTPGLFIGLCIAEFGLVMLISMAINKLSAVTASALFLLYSALTGVTLGPIFTVYEIGAVYQAFFATAGMFAGMSVYALFTKRDLSGWGSFLFMGLIGIIIASIVNIFVASSAMNMIISYIGVLIFAGLTAFDTQKLLRMGESAPLDDATAIQRGTILGALTLYLDFINMFLMLLRIFGNRD